MKKYFNPKIAIVHDSIQYFGGAERVLIALHKTFPKAHIYTSVICWKRLGPFKENILKMHITTSCLQYIPLFRNYPFLFRYYLPFLWKGFNLSNYDIIISSSGSQMSHLVQKRKHAIHICYCHTPPRHLYGFVTDYPWEQHWIIRQICSTLNNLLWKINKNAVKDVDCFIANSRETARRIKKFYKRDSIVISPPVTLTRQPNRTTKKGSYYLSISRLSRMKHVNLIIDAMNALNKPLHVVGIGPEEKNLKQIAGNTITFLGQISDEKLIREYEGCTALICAAEDEDFGITPLEATFYGKPVIAYYSGGYKETVVLKTFGLFFKVLSEKALVEAISRFEHMLFYSDKKRRISHTLVIKDFSNKIKKLVTDLFLHKDERKIA